MVADWLSVFVTTTATAPAARAPTVQVIDVALTTTTFPHATPPTETAAPVRKPVPVIVIEVFPPSGDDIGLTPEIVGAG